jgi:hypothetical protein
MKTLQESCCLQTEAVEHLKPEAFSLYRNGLKKHKSQQ